MGLRIRAAVGQTGGGYFGVIWHADHAARNGRGAVHILGLFKQQRFQPFISGHP